MPYRFREARLQAGLTTVQLAQKIGLTQAAVISGNPAKKFPASKQFLALRICMV